MFYVNNKQVLGIFLNGNNYNYMSFGFGKIIPENRNARFAYINLAQRHLSQYRVEYGNIQSGYDNFPVARLDYPVNGIFHSPLTYYYGGNIVPTKNVPVYINNGYSALRGTVYNDINVNGNIVYFATNTDFQGHNVNIHPENFRSNSPYFNGTVMNNCNNFILHSGSHLSKSSQATLYDCKKFIGWFNFFGDNDGTRFPGFRGFLHTCRDGVFSFNLMNMHGGGSDDRVTNFYNFSCIGNSNNIKLNINGSSWQAWVHPNCYSSNCNITTRYIVPGFDRMNHCNFNIYLPSRADVEKSAFYSILSNATNCNVYFEGTNSNLYSFRNGSATLFLFQDLNNCNLNLLLNSSTGLDYAFGNRLNNCNIHFENMGFKQQGFGFMNNCTLTGNFKYANILAAFAYSSRNVNLNINARNTSDMILLLNVDSVTGNVNLSNDTNIKQCSNSILNLYDGNISFNVVENCKFRLDKVNNVDINGSYSTNFNLYNAAGTAALRNLNNVDFVERGANYKITNLDNCYNSWIYANNLSGLVENVYNTRVELKNNNSSFRTQKVNNCEITGFPTSATYTTNCTFRTSISVAASRNSRYITWANVWPHATPRGSDGRNTLYHTNAGLESVDNFSGCYLNCNDGSLLYSSATFINNNNMVTDIGAFYNGTFTANLPNYNTPIRLNVDCRTLNLGIFQAGPPHRLEYSSISADNIYCTTGTDYYVQINYGTRIYCENFCNVAFFLGWEKFSDNYQPVLLINSYQHSNAGAYNFVGGITRIGSLRYRGGAPFRPELHNGACLFINNAVLNGAIVNNSLLFVGSNVTWANGVNVTNGGLIVNRANYSMGAIGKFVNRKNFTWNFTDSGPWGRRSLLNFCIDV